MLDETETHHCCRDSPEAVWLRWFRRRGPHPRPRKKRRARQEEGEGARCQTAESDSQRPEDSVQTA